MWERPVDLMGKPDVNKAISTIPQQLRGILPKNENKAAVEAVAEFSKKRLESEASSDEEDTSNKKMKMEVTAAGKK